MTRVLVAIAAAVGIAMSLAGCGTNTFTLNGDLAAESCIGTGGYRDINAGATVTVYDATGKVVAVGSLGEGTRDSGAIYCRFPFSIPEVPDNSDFYSVEVSHRGEVTFPADRARNGDVHLSIGT